MSSIEPSETASGVLQNIQRARAPFHVMTKPIGPLCNIKCQYCFYLEKANLFSANHNFKMSDATLEQYVRNYIESQPVQEITFAWQGGEPTLLGVNFFRKAVAYQKKYANGKQIANAFQTNGTLINDEWCEFFVENDFLVGISIDGPADLHNALRVTRKDGPTHDQVMRGVRLCQKHKVEFNTLTVLNRINSQRPMEVYKFLKGIGSKFLQFIPIVEREPAAEGALGPDDIDLSGPPDFANPPARGAVPKVTDWSVRPEDFGAFLCTVFDHWVRNDVGKIFVQIFDVSLGKWAGVQHGGICVFNETCGSAMAIEHNGDVYACDHYVYPRYKVGNVLNESLGAIADGDFMQKFGRDKADALPRYCRECDVRFACNGECPKHRFEFTPDGEFGLNYLCKGYKKFFHHIDPAMAVMAQLYRAQRPPSEIVQLIKKQPNLLKQVAQQRRQGR